MFIAKAYSPRFYLLSGKIIRGGPGSVIVHDETGRVWPKCSGLVLPKITGKTRKPIEDKTAIDYFDTTPLLAEVEVAQLPPKAIAPWRELGDFDEVQYRRTGGNAGAYYHEVKGKATLYKWRAFYRVELHRGCVWNWRGIVKP